MDADEKSSRFDKKGKLLHVVFVAILAVLFSLIVYTPHLIKDNLSMSKNIVFREEIVESCLLVLLLAVGYVILKLYRLEIRKHRQKIEELVHSKTDAYHKLDNAVKYIGEVNIQVQNIQSTFAALQMYPRHKKDFRKILHFLAEKTLSIVSTEWVMFRIINTDNLKTLQEYNRVRDGVTIAISKDKISNKSIIGRESINGNKVIGSDQDTLTIKAFCILPIKKMTVNQQKLIKVIVNELEIIFIFFTSQYYKESQFKKEITFRNLSQQD